MRQERKRRSGRVATELTGVAAGAFVAVLVQATPAAADGSAAASCETLAALTLPNITITLAQNFTGGSFTSPYSTTYTDLPPFCRVAGTITPTSDSVIQFEVWLPTKWDNRYQQVGNGHFGQGVQYARMVEALAAGDATGSTDNGNPGSPSGTGVFAIGHPQKVIDWAYRAVHLTSLAAHDLMRAYYTQNSQWAYFNGCSDGGREALMEAQRFPDDFDGILAGDPAQDLVNQQANGLWNAQALYENPESTISPGQAKAIGDAALAACDKAGDGVIDGVVGNPLGCRFNPSVLLCKGTPDDTCLTAPQVEALRRVYQGAHDPVTGERIFVGQQPGAEGYPTGNNFISGYLNGLSSSQPSSGIEFYSDFVYEIAGFDPAAGNNTNWDYRKFNFDSDLAFARNKLVLGEPLSDVVNAMDPDLSRFRAHGGKLIQYHGWTDPWITPSSVPYYEQVLSATNPADRSIAMLGTQNFYRLFMVPGMQHCHGGPGPVSFGQTTPFVGSASDTIPLSEDPEHDILLAIRAWVEQDAAREKIIAAKYQNDTPAQGVLFSCPLCPYPLTAQYSGSGDTSDAANFSCANEHLRLNRNPGFADRPMEITPQ